MADLGLGILVSLKDMASGNAGRIESSMRSLDQTIALSSDSMTRNMSRIQQGTAMMGAGLALLSLPTTLVSTTTRTQKALGELRSLGVKDLIALEDAAESFTNYWSGTAKWEFITSAYDVRSALSGLTDHAVGEFTAMAALTAKATKAATAEMVGTFTTGYGIFKKMTPDMSDIAWARMFAGGMAQTVASFKTNGKQMADAIKNIGGVAASMNVPLEEQLAILGYLQTTMPGSEAGTLYKAFIMKVAEASKKLGVSLIGPTGQLKGIVPIIGEINKKFPDLSQAAAQIQIKKAFGSDEAVKFLLQMSGGISEVETKIGEVKSSMEGGTRVTEQMARAMNMDVGAGFIILKQRISNLMEILGRSLLPLANALVSGIANLILKLQDLAKGMPVLTRVALLASGAIGSLLFVAGSVITLVGTIGVMLPAIKAGMAAVAAAFSGAMSTIATYFFPVTIAIAGIIGLIWILRKAWASDFAGIHTLVTQTWSRVALAFHGVRALIRSLEDGSGSLSQDMVQRLKAAGLLGFVSKVFQAYFRVRQFLTGMGQAISEALSKARATLEPTFRSIMAAIVSLVKTVFSLFQVFGVNEIDASSFHSLGLTIGTLIGGVIRFGAVMLKSWITPLIFGIKVIGWVVKAVHWLGQKIGAGLVHTGKAFYQIALPLQLLVEGFVTAGTIIHAIWGHLTGQLTLDQSLRVIGQSVKRFLLTPFRWMNNLVHGFAENLRNDLRVLPFHFKWMANRAHQFFFTPFKRLTGWFNAFFINLAKSLFPFRKALKVGMPFTWIFDFIPMAKKALQRVAGVINGWRGKMHRRFLGFISSLNAPFSRVGARMTKTIGGMAHHWRALLGRLKKPLVFHLNAQALPEMLSQWKSHVTTFWRHAQALFAAGWRRVSVIAKGSAILRPLFEFARFGSLMWDRLALSAAQFWNHAVKSAFSALLSIKKGTITAITQIIRAIRRGLGVLISSTSAISKSIRGLIPNMPGLWKPKSNQTKQGSPLRHHPVSIPSPRKKRGHGRTAGIMEGYLAASSGFLKSLVNKLPEMPAQKRATPSILRTLGPTVLSPRFLTRHSVPAPAMIPIPDHMQTESPELPQHRRALLFETRSVHTQPLPSDGDASTISSLFRTLIEKMDGLVDRPIQATLPIHIDGRELSETVYQDLRERKIKHYETL